jgi:hypothetical protein
MFYTTLSQEQVVQLQKDSKINNPSNEKIAELLGWERANFYRVKKMLADNNLIETHISRDNKGNIKKNYTIIKQNVLRSKVQPDWTQQNSFEKQSPARLDSAKNKKEEKVTQREERIILNNNKHNKGNNSNQVNNGTMDNSTNGNSIYNNITSNIEVEKSQVLKSPSLVGELTSKNSHAKMTDLEVWEMAVNLDVPLFVIKETEENYFDYIEDPKMARKYKTTYRTVRNWVKMRLDKNQVQVCNEVEKLQLPLQHPDEVAKRKEAREIAERNGWL